MADAPTIAVADLSDFVARALGARGVPEGDAAKVAALMVEADIYGYGTHGVFRLRQYLARLGGGGCNAAPNVSVAEETVSTAVIDGDNGLGHLAMSAARDLAIEKARATGIGWVGVRRGNHAGPLALYVRPQAEAGLLGMAAAVGSANHVPPYGGSDLLLGTNPIAFSAPSAGPDPFVFDMATTVAAMGKIKTLLQQGEPMPEGWMVGRDGKPLTDPARKSEGFLLPIGGPKGFGLSVAIGLMAGVLNGAAFGSDVVDFTKDTTSETNTGQFVMALDPVAFGLGDGFGEAASRVFDEMRASPPLPGHDPVRLPGDGKTAAAQTRRDDGLRLKLALCRDLNELAADCAIAAPFPGLQTG
ncbi:Ldh family oxidoreductase [Antarctobacter heliothermus]|uniref:Malate/lactate/ureidoglycolate dehydrogenase, LDH2 family n=1 Tax=Antarctobacter heliothermus TaxID=74033 RepID=A0A239LTB8_9RHOB|nr:Ldh family oxidoreductase [Antarctobacter heliothermus]SNT33053.1 Malate/lactate/ureidoglycolate dehydrogenase, LDH2 family [Antarctobacter heliothermus]